MPKEGKEDRSSHLKVLQFPGGKEEESVNISEFFRDIIEHSAKAEYEPCQALVITIDNQGLYRFSQMELSDYDIIAVLELFKAMFMSHLFAKHNN